MWSKMLMQEDPGFTSSMEYNKSHLFIERFLLEKNWGVTEQLLHNKREKNKREQKERQRHSNEGKLHPKLRTALGRDSTEDLGVDSSVLGHKTKS